MSNPPPYTQPSTKRVITLSTCITLLRIALVPVLVSCIGAQAWGYVLILFSIAAMSDVLDGSLARLRNEQTFVGACLDPIADKILLLSCFAALASMPSTYHDTIPTWFVWLVLVKELLLVGSILIIYICQGGVAVVPTLLGKLTTVAQISTVMAVVISYFFSVTIGFFFSWLLYGTSIMTISSYVHYACMWYKQRYTLKQRVMV
jgi:cardiolipin synthase